MGAGIGCRTLAAGLCRSAAFVVRYKQHCYKLIRDWSVSLCSWKIDGHVPARNQRDSNGLLASERRSTTMLQGGEMQGSSGSAGMFRFISLSVTSMRDHRNEKWE